MTTPDGQTPSVERWEELIKDIQTDVWNSLLNAGIDVLVVQHACEMLGLHPGIRGRISNLRADERRKVVEEVLRILGEYDGFSIMKTREVIKSLTNPS